MTSDDYVIATARERLEAWATNQGKSIIHINGDYSVSGSIRTDLLTYSSDNQSTLIVVSIACGISITLLGAFILKKKRREN